MLKNGPAKESYARRRAALCDKLENAVVFIAGPPEAVYSNDVHYRYRPDTNIRYLSGFEEPAGLLIAKTNSEEDGFTLFVRPNDPTAEIWNGRRAGIDGAQQGFGADYAFALDDMLGVLERHLRRAERLFFSRSLDHTINEKVMDLVHTVNLERPRTGTAHIVVSDVRALLDDMRLVKDDEELDLLRRACSISADAHRRMMEETTPGMTEYQVEAALEHDFRMGGCSAPAYGTIAAGGANATILHYTQNDMRLADGDLILIDAGGEYGGYCADITRTWPIGQHFTKEQAALYDIVLEAQKAAVGAVRPGATIEIAHDAAVGVLAQGLVDLGLCAGTATDCIESGSFREFYMHRTSHWLGMDVHDAGSYRNGEQPRPLEAGMVLTIEPGLYVAESAPNADRYRGIGIRIEDDVVVTNSGCDVLTGGVPKERAEIEALRACAVG